MDKKPEKKSSAGIGIVIAALGLLWSIAGSTGSRAGAGVAVIIVIAAVVGIAVYVSKKAKDSKSADFQPAKIFTQQKKAQEYQDCDDEHYVPVTDDGERRGIMLSNMLKSGLVSREEYDILQKRWGLK